MTQRSETATLGGGCFWCVEAALEQLDGVLQVISGYAGGSVPNPTYREVCSGRTGHAEVVRVHFDPARIDYADLLRIFFTVHDPTTPDRQGGDVGTQYRSVIQYHSDTQKEIAGRVIEELEQGGVWGAPFVTELVPVGDFYAAEDYHQSYYRNNRSQPYCQVVIEPKLAKLRQHHAAKLTGDEDPVEHR